MTGKETVELHDFEQTLRKGADEIVGQLENGDFSGAIQVIHRLSEARNEALYHEVGKLTRALHESIKSFHNDMEHNPIVANATNAAEVNNIADASERLSYVLELTSNAANRTMDMVDMCVPLADQLGNQAQMLRKDWSKLVKREMDAQAFRELFKRTSDFLTEVEKGSTTLNSNLTEILMAQGYQDLTGQLIKRVITLVTEVERSLVSMVRMAGKVDCITGIKHDMVDVEERNQQHKQKGEGPQLPSAGKKDVVSGQDEVDDLLSSLGF
ncbi:protein phosphatase CheZ [Balneatrix alpica]|uniref:Protein phosphatase CheZ n=1 Tax=Balneatrix alpica TaxID=75684 RepID=A0ABV5ZE59_9GAMM|nr:protein phosphatase CheZ [Balneatrix alpica]